MISLKLKIQELPEEMLTHLREYNKLSRCVFNLMTKREISHKESVKFIESNYSYNRDIIDNTILIDHIGIKTDMLVKSNRALGNKSSIFGTKYHWKTAHQSESPEIREKHSKIFDEKRNLSGCLYTGRTNAKGNAKVKLDTINNQILFKPRRGICIPIKYKTSKKRQRELENIQRLGEAKLIPYAVEIAHDQICILVDENKITEYQPDYIRNRVASFDANPNFNGLTIIDYDGIPNGKFDTVYKEVMNVSELNKTHNPNKIKTELNNQAKRVAKLLKHYKVEVFGYEDLSMSGSLEKGKFLNRLCNNDWKRQHFLQSLLKWCNIYRIKTQKVKAHYSSTIGCLNFPDDTDCISASYELNRRTYVFFNKFINKNKDFANVEVIYPPFSRENLEERWNSILETTKGKLGWVSLHKHIKQSKPNSLRFLYKDFTFSDDWISFRPRSAKSLVLIHSWGG